MKCSLINSKFVLQMLTQNRIIINSLYYVRIELTPIRIAFLMSLNIYNQLLNPKFFSLTPIVDYFTLKLYFIINRIGEADVQFKEVTLISLR